MLEVGRRIGRCSARGHCQGGDLDRGFAVLEEMRSKTRLQPDEIMDASAHMPALCRSSPHPSRPESSQFIGAWCARSERRPSALPFHS